jgi:lysozyme
MFSAVAGMASMFGLKRKEETQTAVLEDIYGDLQKIKTSFKITLVPASEEREKEFDKEKRHQELLAAFKRSGLAMSRAASSKDGDKDKDKKGNWLSKLAMSYFSYRVLKGFIKRFFKVMRLGRLWTLLRGMGFLLTRLFWPLAVAAALIWVIPKIIDNWPTILQTVKDTVNGIWDTIKGWLSFLGIDFEEDEQEDILGSEEGLAQAQTAQDLVGNDFTPRWVESSPGKGTWMVNGTALPGLGINDGVKAASIAAAMRAGNSITDMQAAMGTESGDIVPQQTLAGDDVLEFGFDNNFVSMVKEAEGFRGEAYQDEAGNWTVGYGHTGADVKAGTTMSESAATAQLGFDLDAARGRAAVQVDKDFGAGTFGNLSQNKQNLLTDVAFNTGSVSSMPKLTSAVVSGDKAGIASEFKRSMTTSSGDKKPLTGRNQLVKDNLIAPILSAPSSSISSSGGMGSDMSTITPTISTTPTETIPGKLNPKVTVVDNDPVVIDSSVTQTAANSSRATNKDYGTGNPFMGLYT